MMNTVNPTLDPANPADHPESAAARHHKRSREEVEALAKNFVATPVEEVPPPPKPRTRVALAGAGVALLAVLAFVVWPRREAERAATTAEPSRATAEAEQWRQRYEAERERKRKELAGGKEYLERIAAADTALFKDMTERAQQLAERAAAAPAPARESVPTPREEPAKVAPKPAASSSAPAETASSPAPAPAPAPVKPAPPQEVAKAAPAPATTAPAATAAPAVKASCAIHVSELSSSGKLTYEAVKGMKGVRVDANGHVFTPPVAAGGGRTVVFEVMPDSCVRVVRSAGR
jgi:hypothetical protein